MPIREDLVASAAKFLQDPSVASSPVENRIAFLQSKNLTQEEVQAALARAENPASPPYSSPAGSPAPPPPSSPPAPYYGGYPSYGWQQPPPEVPRRDWRDWFIMATVVGGVGYGLYALGKRYVYPLIAPPTPERLETDKKAIDEQFERAFALVEQLQKDTEALKASEQERTERLDTALTDLEAVLADIKSANRRRDDEAQRVRDDMKGIKDSIPRALEAQKSLTDNRLQEVNAELRSLKTIISQRLNPHATSASVSNYLRPSSGNVTPTSPSPAPGASSSSAAGAENAAPGGGGDAAAGGKASPGAAYDLGSSPFSSGVSAAAVKIPEWQRAMVTKKASSSSVNSAAGVGSSSQAEAGGSSS